MKSKNENIISLMCANAKLKISEKQNYKVFRIFYDEFLTKFIDFHEIQTASEKELRDYMRDFCKKYKELEKQNADLRSLNQELAYKLAQVKESEVEEWM